jgi:XTP/dITP diphosphohydrolase
MELLVATHNMGKLKEYQDLFPDIQFVNLSEIGMGKMEVDETSDTFIGNASLKAVSYGRASGRITLSDDSGLCVDALDGEPGVISARYGGAGLDDAGRRAYLLEQVKHVPLEERTAYFICVTVAYHPVTQQTIAAEGIVYGHILTHESLGDNGFGYDKLFVPSGYTMSFADMSNEQKNQLSHRALATQKLRDTLKAWVE